MIFRMFLLMLLFIAATSASVKQDVYVVHMDKAKMEALDNVEPSKRWYDAIFDMIDPSPGEAEGQEPATSSAQLLYVYDTVYSGFAAKLSNKHLQRLKEVDGFLKATRDRLLHLHTTDTPQFLGLEEGLGPWSPANLHPDVIIGLIDTGVWPEHKSFHDSGMLPVPDRWKGKCETGTKFTPLNCNKKLIGARAFYKGYEEAFGRINETIDYRSPRDSEGHGTHTASTAAGSIVKGANCLGFANGTAIGMRYTSRIAAYKVCYPEGCVDSDVIAGMEQAVKDGVDILSISLGGGGTIPYYYDDIAIASFRAVAKGILVSCSAGNSGPSISVENGAPWIMTVAASYIDRSFPTLVRLGDGQSFTGSSLYPGKKTKQLPLAYNETAGGESAEYCFEGTLSSELVEGKLVVCEEADDPVTTEGNVRRAGGAGTIILNTNLYGEEILAYPFIGPSTYLGSRAAAALRKYIKSSENPTASIEFLGTSYGDQAPAMAVFSSRGPLTKVDPDVIKPDVTAPGFNILAGWPPKSRISGLESDTRRVLFNIISGTSMSCPHASGIAALIKSAHRDWSPAAIKSALMTTAYTMDNTKAPIADVSTGKAATPFNFGSGHVDPGRAIDPGLVYDISENDYLIYLCSLGYNSTQLSLFYSGEFTCPGDADVHRGDLNYPSFSVLFSDDTEKSGITYKRTVTNVGEPKSSYSVKVTEPEGVLVSVDPQVLNFQRLGEKLSYKVSVTPLPQRKTKANYAFGELVWHSSKNTVRSPIAVMWKSSKTFEQI